MLLVLAVGWLIGNVVLGLLVRWLETWCWRSVVDVGGCLGGNGAFLISV